MAADCIYITQDCFWNIVIYAVCQNKRTAFRVFDSYILDEILETAKRRLLCQTVCIIPLYGVVYYRIL